VRCIKQYDVLTTIAVLNDPAFSGIANLSTSTVLLVVSPHVLLEPKILNASSHFVYLTPKRPHDAPATASDASRLRLSWETILLVLCRICYVKRAKATSRSAGVSPVRSTPIPLQQTMEQPVAGPLGDSAAHASKSQAARPVLPLDMVNALQ
jgi:hypothetical protein